MTTHVRRQQPHVIAADILSHYGGKVRYDLARFSPKWLDQYRPVSLYRKVRRGHAVTRFLEAIGFLPECYAVVAHFDADANTFVVFGQEHLEPMRRAAQDISEAIGVEVTVVKEGELTVQTA